MDAIIWVKRRIRLLGVKTGFITKGSKLWYYYLPTDKILDTEINKNKSGDIIMRGNKFNVKPKTSDILRNGFVDRKEIAQVFVDWEDKFFQAKNYFTGNVWDI